MTVAMESTKTNLEVAVEWFDRVWKQEDASAIDDLFIPDGAAHGLGAQTMYGPEDFKVFHRALLSHIAEVDVSIDKFIETAPWVALLCTVNAKCRRTGKPVSFSGQIFGRMDGGKFIEGYNNFDFLTMFAQLGRLPDTIFEDMLAAGTDC